MKTVSTFRLACWIIAVTSGCVALLVGFHFAATMILGLSGVLLISRQELSIPVPIKDSRTVLLWALAMPLLLVGIYSIWNEAQVERTLTRPAVVIPFWSLIVLGTIRKWRRERLAELTAQSV